MLCVREAYFEGGPLDGQVESLGLADSEDGVLPLRELEEESGTCQYYDFSKASEVDENDKQRLTYSYANAERARELNQCRDDINAVRRYTALGCSVAEIVFLLDKPEDQVTNLRQKIMRSVDARTPFQLFKRSLKLGQMTADDELTGDELARLFDYGWMHTMANRSRARSRLRSASHLQASGREWTDGSN